jgi:hypothetical protein
MAENPVSKLSTALDSVVSSEQKVSVEILTDALWRESWAYHCDHQDKHLDAIALANPDDKEIQARVALLKEVIAAMRAEGMPEITAIRGVI